MTITVDDFGYNHQANQLIFKAIEKGVIGQASTMVNMGGTQEALNYIAMSRRKASRQNNLGAKIQKSKVKMQNDNSKFKNILFGLHLNLTEGKPISHPKDVSSLVDENGQLLGWQGLIKRAIFGQLRPQEIEKELRAQIEKLQTVVKPIPFLNSHHHIHLWPLIARVVIPLCQEYGITQIRWPRKIWWQSVLSRYGLKALTIQLLTKLSSIDHRLLSNDYFFDLDWGWRDSGTSEKITGSFPLDIELACHPPTTHGLIIKGLIRKEGLK